MALIPMEEDIGFVVEGKGPTSVPTVQAGNVGDCDITITKSGYTPIGIAGFAVGGAVVSVAQALLVSQTTARIRFVNNTTYAQTPSTVIAYVLYMKN